jgi:hypothetical protein
VINGFYMSMREAYVKFGASIHWFTVRRAMPAVIEESLTVVFGQVEWSPDTLSWEDFRAKVGFIGRTEQHFIGRTGQHCAIVRRCA